MLVHATCVALDGRGILICGPSGSGKSDLALRLLDGGAVLVSDDQVALAAEAGQLVARPPAAIAGRMEVRGIGIVALPHAPRAVLALAVDLVPPSAVPRLPEAERRTLLGIDLPLLRLDGFAASACAKLRLALYRGAV